MADERAREAQYEYRAVRDHLHGNFILSDAHPYRPLTSYCKQTELSLIVAAKMRPQERFSHLLASCVVLRWVTATFEPDHLLRKMKARASEFALIYEILFVYNIKGVHDMRGRRNSQYM